MEFFLGSGGPIEYLNRKRGELVHRSFWYEGNVGQCANHNQRCCFTNRAGNRQDYPGQNARQCRRQDMRSYDLPAGCAYCKSSLTKGSWNSSNSFLRSNNDHRQNQQTHRQRAGQKTSFQLEEPDKNSQAKHPVNN